MGIDSGIHNPSHKSHRSRQSGPSAKKNKKKRDIPSDKIHNPKVISLFFFVCILRNYTRVHKNWCEFWIFARGNRHLRLLRLWKQRDYSRVLRRKSSVGFIFQLLIVILANPLPLLLLYRVLHRYSCLSGVINLHLFSICYANFGQFMVVKKNAFVRESIAKVILIIKKDNCFLSL